MFPIVWREPMFAFEFDQALFEFRYERPAFDPLFALPPHRHSSSLSATYRTLYASGFFMVVRLLYQ